MGISTNVNVSTGTNNRKTFGPGNRIAKIVNVSLQKPAFAKEGDKMYYLQIVLESEPVGGEFEGFLKDKNDPSKGRYKGRICTIKHSKYAFETKTITKNGKEYKFDLTQEILKFLTYITLECKSDFMSKIDGKYDTIEDIVKAFNKAKPFKDIMMNWCIAADEYYKEQYIEYRCYLPKFVKGYKLFKAVTNETDMVLPYNVEDHLVKAEKPAELDDFESEDDDIVVENNTTDSSLTVDDDDDIDFDFDEDIESPFNED